MQEPDLTASIDGARVLVVDDDEIIRKLLRRVLERSDFTVDEAGSGEQAIERITEAPPDLILLDVIMDGLDGFDACRRIKELDGMDAVPIVFVTGRSDTASIVEGLEAGGSDYVTKPINRHEVVARIRTHLKMRALVRQQAEFIDMLKHANFAKNKVIGVASHDMRNPLISIKGITEFLEGAGPLNEDQKEMVETIRTSSEVMLHLVDELLDLAVIDSGEDRFEFKPVALGEIVSESLNIYRFTANRKSIELQMENRGVPEPLMLDRNQFRRVVDNLLSNAVKYSPEGTRVRVLLEARDGVGYLVVEDEGSGIPEDEMHKLFTDFGKTSVRPTGNESSTGLGLSICRKIVETHHGSVAAENRTDRSGARFIVRLDLARLDPAGAAQPRQVGG